MMGKPGPTNKQTALTCIWRDLNPTAEILKQNEMKIILLYLFIM